MIFLRLANNHRSPNARLYVARSLREMGRLDEAHDAMARTVEEATARAMREPRFEATRKAAQAQLDDLKTRVAYLTLLDAITIFSFALITLTALQSMVVTRGLAEHDMRLHRLDRLCRAVFPCGYLAGVAAIVTAYGI